VFDLFPSIPEKRGGIFLKKIRIVLSAAAFLLAVYGLITENFKYNSIMIFLLGLMFFVWGLEEYQNKRRANGVLYVGASIFMIVVAINSFMVTF
jgi:hypothetical protein